MTAETKILVVEDNLDDIMILQRHFSRLEGNYHVDIAYSAAEAFERAERQRYDIAFVDQHLPDIHGEALIREIQERRPNLPIIMLTGQGDERLAVEVMKAGASDYLRKDDLSRSILARALRNALARAKLKAELQRLAITDELTGLFNRRHFNAVIETEFARAQRYRQPLACLMLDIDHFKRFNDTRGHACGDAVLCHLADVLRGIARQVDVVARYGGEEFALLLPNTDLDGAWAVAERIRRSTENSIVRFSGEELTLTLSVGVATSKQDSVDNTDALIKWADEALHRAKRDGRNRVERGDSRVSISQNTTTNAIMNRRAPTAAVVYLIDHHDAKIVGRAGHTQRVALLAHRLGRAMGHEPVQLEGWVLAAYLTGLGRLLVPLTVWNTRGPLSAAQKNAVAEAAWHTREMLDQTGIGRDVRHIILNLDERWDGSGPDKLAGERIPAASRALTLVDIWCALRAHRPWRSALSVEAAIAELRARAGQQLDPDMVELFCALKIADGEDDAR